MRDLPERDEREEAVVGNAAQADRREEQLERARTVGATATLQLLVPGAPRLRERREVAQHEYGDDDSGNEQDEPALRADRGQRGARDERPERDAEIAAGLEERDAACASLAARMTCELHPLGMEGADAEPGDRVEHQHDRVL